MAFRRLNWLVVLLALVVCAPAAAQDADADDEQATEAQPEPEPPAQPTPPAAESATDDDELAALLLAENEGRGRINRIGALVLGGWAIGNFGWATVGLLRQPDDREQAFHLTNAAFNLVVAGIGIGAYFGNVPSEEWESMDTLATLNEGHNTEKLYLLAAGLDVAYIMSGAFLTAKGNLDRKEGMVGVGRSLMLQGTFLFAFDAAMYTFHMLRRTRFLKNLVGAESSRD